LLRAIAFIATGIAVSGQVLSADVATNPSVVASTFASSALLGMQLSVRKGSQQGRVSPGASKCVQVLGQSSFNDVFVSLLAETLSQSELQAAEAFFGTAVGKKYAQFGLMQVYTSAGETPPEQPPTFSDSEYKELEGFSRTSAGEKLIVRKILQSDSAQRTVGARTQSLVKSCGVSR
jgi:hypothetical protein